MGEVEYRLRGEAFDGQGRSVDMITAGLVTVLVAIIVVLTMSATPFTARNYAATDRGIAWASLLLVLGGLLWTP